MRHRKGITKLGRPTDQRIALLRNLVISLIQYGKIETTEAKAREAIKMAERVITLGKNKSVSSIRNVLKIIPHKESVKKIFDEVSINYKDRNGGYIRITKTRLRQGDATQMAVIELIKD
ncbi:MAG: 50S ribosomal protein L17 [Candidatus Margulisiibacteriota bacterium]|nr:MAG: 50S ribosomal protein L17 [Candidatus Margulisbacteria bacterium GWF2_38_17]OGI11849.1 MAG: 50S ribosomal protein L17 [Candidatus Margulisbacteria bacterium GWE2_39_32]PZM79776.1 MAG: 50S ribosomal protein L17 [Candidatus Margulisiibacteriota bacterium]HCT85146.1 50S ribosomal protein L17 [Candidatus Margulisiibacteriota bacterium]HCY36824.1 50S ribosomal protein L17 [Candidatus Margulisiibacteriota bacterium]